jgi:cell division protein FtsA
MNHNEAPIIVGLDIGTTKIAAIAGRKNEFGKLEILALAEPIAMVFNMVKC